MNKIEFLESTINSAAGIYSKRDLQQHEKEIMKQWTDAFVEYNNHHEEKLTMANKSEFETVLNWMR